MTAQTVDRIGTRKAAGHAPARKRTAAAAKAAPAREETETTAKRATARRQTETTAKRAPARKQTAAAAKAAPARKRTAAPAKRVTALRQTGAPRAGMSGKVGASVGTGPTFPVAHAMLAAERAVRRNGMQLQLPVVGEVRLPSADDLAFLGGVAVLAVVGLVEWPIAVVLGVGHSLAASRHNKMIRAFGEALAEA